MKVTIILIGFGAFGTVTKGLLKGLEDFEVGNRVETIQTTALLKTARILRRALETREYLQPLNLQWKTISLRWCEKLSWVNSNYYNNNKIIFDGVMKFIEKSIENWRVKLIAGKKFSWGENKERYPPERNVIIVTICNGDDVTQSHTSETHRRIQTN